MSAVSSVYCHSDRPEGAEESAGRIRQISRLRFAPLEMTEKRFASIGMTKKFFAQLGMTKGSIATIWMTEKSFAPIGMKVLLLVLYHCSNVLTMGSYGI